LIERELGNVGHAVPRYNCQCSYKGTTPFFRIGYNYSL